VAGGHCGQHLVAFPVVARAVILRRIVLTSGDRSNPRTRPRARGSTLVALRRGLTGQGL